MSVDIPGTIEKIELENFMCHKHLVLDLSSQVNFIVGENGSGKSAILVALAICFGAKAQFTNRGKRASDVIKSGENYCKIIVYLRNRGDGALNQDKYGETIVIERRITKEGANSYKISALSVGEKVRVIGKKATDVNEILDHFNIPIDNPCILLMQDTSKTFLTATRGEDKYKFFLQATQLDIIKESYKQSEELCKKAKHNEETKKLIIPDMEKEIEQLESKLKNAFGVHQLKKKIEELNAEEKWALLRDQKNKIKRLQEECDLLEDKMKEMDKGLIEKRIELIKDQMKKEQEQINQIIKEIKELEDKKVEELEKSKMKKRELTNFQSEIDSSKESLNLNKKRIKLLEDNLEESRSHDKKDFEFAKQEKEEKIHSADLEISKCQNKESLLKEELKPLERELEEKARKFGGYDDDVKRIRRRLEEQNREKKGLEDEQKDALTKYHKAMPQFVRAVQQSTFEHEVFGPIGECLKLKDNRWNHAVENCIKRNNLASFIVRSENDKRKLKEIARKVGFDVQIYVYLIKFGNGKYGVKKNEFPTILQQLEIEKSVVFNVLVDHIKIDAIGVAVDRIEGKRLLQTETGPKLVYLQNGSLMQKSGKTEAFFPYRIPTRTIYGGKNIDELFVEINEVIRQTTIDLSGKEELRKIAEQEKSDTNIQIGQLRRKVREAERDTRLALNKKKEAENIVIKEPDDIEELEQNVNKMKDKLKGIYIEIEQGNQKRKILEKENEELNERINDINKQIKIKEKEIKEIKTSLNEDGIKLDELKEQRGNEEKKKKEVMVQLQKKNEDLKYEILREQQVKEEADEFEFVDTKRILEIIQREKERCIKKEAELNSENIDYDQIEKEFNLKKSRLESILAQLKQVQDLCEKLEFELERRKNKYNQLLRVTSTKTMEYFDGLLKKKPGCKGRIKLDHLKRLLDVEVSMDSEKERDVKTLSGGERSFSTVCLLLSLWNVVDCPFRAMDEFDVYMDSMARKVAIEALMESTHAANKRQYIFITPHHLDGVASTESVKVFMMKKPER